MYILNNCRNDRQFYINEEEGTSRRESGKNEEEQFCIIIIHYAILYIYTFHNVSHDRAAVHYSHWKDAKNQDSLVA